MNTAPLPNPDLLRRDMSRVLADAFAQLGIAGAGLDALGSVGRLQHALHDLEQHAVRKARREGATWEQIGDELGISRQSAHERFRHLV